MLLVLVHIFNGNLGVRLGRSRFVDLECGSFFLPLPIARILACCLGYNFPLYVCSWSCVESKETLTELGN